MTDFARLRETKDSEPATLRAGTDDSSGLTPSVRSATRVLDVATVRRGRCPVPVLNKALGEFPVDAGAELYSDGRVPKVASSG